MNIIITDEIWERTCLLGHKLTSSPSWREFDWKIKIRVFRTPLVLARYSDTSNLCWRQCGKVGDHTHIFWDCPKLYQCWRDIQVEIKLSLGVKPACFILGDTPAVIDSQNQKYLLGVMLLIAKQVITVLWRKEMPPNVQQWRERLKNVYLMESITAKLQLRTDAFNIIWKPVLLQMPRLIKDMIG